MTVGGGGTDVGVSDGVCAKTTFVAKRTELPNMLTVKISFFIVQCVTSITAYSIAFLGVIRCMINGSDT